MGGGSRAGSRRALPTMPIWTPSRPYRSSWESRVEEGIEGQGTLERHDSTHAAPHPNPPTHRGVRMTCSDHHHAGGTDIARTRCRNGRQRTREARGLSAGQTALHPVNLGSPTLVVPLGARTTVTLGEKVAVLGGLGNSLENLSSDGAEGVVESRPIWGGSKEKWATTFLTAIGKEVWSDSEKGPRGGGGRKTAPRIQLYCLPGIGSAATCPSPLRQARS